MPRQPIPRDQRIALLRAMTPRLEAEGWRTIESVPKDGTEIEIRIVHDIAADADDAKEAEEEGYIAVTRAHWIDHNRGGLTWNGLAGVPCQWRPITP